MKGKEIEPQNYHPRAALKGQHHRNLSRQLVQSLSGVPRNFVRWKGGSTNSVEDRGQRKRGSGGSSPVFRGSGGSCNLVQEISFHIVKFA